MDSGAAHSVWPEDLMSEVQPKPSAGSQTVVAFCRSQREQDAQLRGEEGPRTGK